MKNFRHTKGYVGEISADLKALLRYMDGAAPENEYTRALDSAVTAIRMDEKWRRDYMLLSEKLRESKRLGRLERSVSQVRAFRNEFQPEQLARFVFISPELLRAILDAIDAHPDWDDETVAENVDFE